LFAELFDRVNRWEDDYTETVMIFVVADAVEQEPIIGQTLPIDGVGGRTALLCIGNAPCQLRLTWHHTRTQSQQLGKIPTIEWQIVHSFFGAQIRDCCGLGIKLSR